MSYTSYDFFYEHIAPKMVELFKEFNPNDTGETYDKFKEILKGSLDQERSEKFQSDLVNMSINPDGTLTVEKAVEKFFNIFVYDDMTLRKIEYASGGAIIGVDYEGVYREQEAEE
jgi:hypothetical protein